MPAPRRGLLGAALLCIRWSLVEAFGRGAVSVEIRPNGRLMRRAAEPAPPAPLEESSVSGPRRVEIELDVGAAHRKHSEPRPQKRRLAGQPALQLDAGGQSVQERSEYSGLLRDSHGTCLSVYGLKHEGKVAGRPCRPGSPDQLWVYDMVNGRLKSSGGRCLDAHALGGDGQGVCVRPCRVGSAGQLWSRGERGELKIAGSPGGDSSCLESHSAEGRPAAQLRSCTGHDGQIWGFLAQAGVAGPALGPAPASANSPTTASGKTFRIGVAPAGAALFATSGSISETMTIADDSELLKDFAGDVGATARVSASGEILSDGIAPESIAIFVASGPAISEDIGAALAESDSIGSETIADTPAPARPTDSLPADSDSTGSKTAADTSAPLGLTGSPLADTDSAGSETAADVPTPSSHTGSPPADSDSAGSEATAHAPAPSSHAGLPPTTPDSARTRIVAHTSAPSSHAASPSGDSDSAGSSAGGIAPAPASSSSNSAAITDTAANPSPTNSTSTTSTTTTQTSPIAGTAAPASTSHAVTEGATVAPISPSTKGATTTLGEAPAGQASDQLRDIIRHLAGEVAAGALASTSIATTQTASTTIQTATTTTTAADSAAPAGLASTTTTQATSTMVIPVFTCVDALSTGIHFVGGTPASCEDLKNYCNDDELGYKVVQECPRSCGLCGHELANDDVVDVDPGVPTQASCSDENTWTMPVFTFQGQKKSCRELEWYCEGYVYSELLARKCPKTCGRCLAEVSHIIKTAPAGVPVAATTQEPEPSNSSWCVMGCSRRRTWGFCCSRRRRG